MSRSTLADPLKIFRFKVIIPGGAGVDTVAGFYEVAGLDTTFAVDENRGGAQNDSAQVSLGLPSHGEVTFKRGQIINVENTLSTDLFYNWYSQGYHQQAQGYADREYRRDITIQQLYRHGATAKTWTIINCIPSYFKPFGDLNGGESGNSIEEIRVRHEGFGHAEGINPPPLGGTLNDQLGISA